MNHSLNKQNIFDFFKGQSFIKEINSDRISIKEDQKEASLREVIVTALNPSSKYWLLDTESNAFQLQGKKVENIILEQTQENLLRIIMVELKSTRVRESEVINKFKNSLSFVYILLHLLEGKANQKINVYGIVVTQKDMHWNEKSTLKIFSSTSIRYIKRSFFTNNSEIKISFSDIIKSIEQQNRQPKE